MRTPALRSSGARAAWRVLALVAAVSLLAAPRAASAQLGKLKKMGADAIKDAAKDKLGIDKKAPATDAATAAGGTKAAGIPTLDDDRIVRLASLKVSAIYDLLNSRTSSKSGQSDPSNSSRSASASASSRSARRARDFQYSAAERQSHSR